MRFSPRLSAAALVALGALAAPEAQALVLYEQSDIYDSGNCKFQCSGTQYGAENFVLSSGATVGAMSLWVMLDPAATLTSVDVSWGIWSDDSDLPDSELASGVAAADFVNVGVANSNYDFIRLDFDVTPTALAAGEYWASFHLDAVVTSSLYWARTTSGDGITAKRLEGDVWTAGYTGGTDNYAFLIDDGVAATSEVPLPAAAPLLAAGLAGLAAVARRRRRGA
ncbi:MAG: VPLPA-CTERM sorting domain-containing protein [Pseudomonadota bacterium]|nr:VPLPA-CTERM sorting domain-containing protein [Pseudomonadota bacterium]